VATRQHQLRLVLEAPARVRHGEPVLLIFTITNPGPESVTLQLLGRAPSADFRVSDARGRIVWSHLRGKTMLGALRLFPLDAGKHLVFRHAWDQHGDDGTPVPPGEYLARGVLLTDDPAGLVSAPARFRIDRGRTGG
jgi:intracellular proteinase inhibitor BsuPI